MLLDKLIGIINDGTARCELLLCLCGIIDGICWLYLDRSGTLPRHGQTTLAIPNPNYQYVCRTGTNGYRIRHVSTYARYLRDTLGSCMADFQRNNAHRFGTLACLLSNAPENGRPQ